MKEINISQLGDYDLPFCEQQYTHGSYYISLFKFKSFNTPQTTSNFRHLLSCGTIVALFNCHYQNYHYCKIYCNSLPITILQFIIP